MNEAQMRCETAKELWDYLEQYVWPLGGKLLDIGLSMSETKNPFFIVTYETPDAKTGVPLVKVAGAIGGGGATKEIHPAE